MKITITWNHYEFLCLGHRKQLAQQNNQVQQSLWQEWMNKAALHYEFQQWSQAASYLGCAFELASLSLANQHGEENNNVRQLTLAAIHLVNCIEQMKEYKKAEFCSNESQQILLRHWSKDTRLQDYKTIACT